MSGLQSSALPVELSKGARRQARALTFSGSAGARHWDARELVFHQGGYFVLLAFV